MNFPLYTVAGQKEYYSKAMLDGFCFDSAQKVIIDHCIDLNITVLQPIANFQNCGYPRGLAASKQSPKIACAFESFKYADLRLNIYDVNTRERLFTLDCICHDFEDCAFS